jgi:hypothetical protein
MDQRTFKKVTEGYSEEEKRFAMENIRKQEAWEKSPEGIAYSTDIRDAVLPIGATPHENLIVEVLSKLPARTRGKVQGNATFFVTYGDSYVTHGTGKWVILLHFKRRDSDRAKRLTIAHEIGHLLQYLKDPHGSGGYEAEKAADDFAERYGFGRAYSKEQLAGFEKRHGRPRESSTRGRHKRQGARVKRVKT